MAAGKLMEKPGEVIFEIIEQSLARPGKWSLTKPFTSSTPEVDEKEPDFDWTRHRIWSSERDNARVHLEGGVSG